MFAHNATTNLRESIFPIVRRIGEAQHPGPGKFRLHRRGKRSAEAKDARRAGSSHHGVFKADHPPGSAVEVAEGSHEQNDESQIRRMLVVWHVNIQGLRSSVAELVARIPLACITPMILCLNETFLDHSIGEVEVEGFDLIAPWDRSYERGGVCLRFSRHLGKHHSSFQIDRYRACLVYASYRKGTFPSG